MQLIRLVRSCIDAEVGCFPLVALVKEAALRVGTQITFST